MAMNFYNTQLSPEIGLLNIGAFDIDNRADASKLKHIFRCLFQLNDRLFFSFRRQEDLTDIEALEKLKINITKTFDSSGEYVMLEELDEIRFDSIAQLTVQDSTFDFLLDTWRYFYNCAFFYQRMILHFQTSPLFKKR